MINPFTFLFQKNRIKALGFVIFLFLISSCGSAQRTLIWEENFDGTALNEEYWNYELGNGCPNLCGWGNNEPQYYTKTNHKVADGYLTITARKEEDGRYTSTRITTQNKFEFTYGTIEARAKVATGKGVWPAFWMLGANITEVGWPLSGEIDILEYVGKEPDIVFTTIHSKSSYGNTINTKKTKIEDIEDGFHVFAANWTPDKIDFLVDGKVLYTYAPEEKNEETWPFNKPFYVLLNMAIGGNLGGPEIDDAIFPQEYIIDYIRVYEN